MLYIFLIIIFSVLQAVLAGNIHILGVATPLLYVYFAILFPRNYSRWAQLVLCFAMGLTVDMFANTPGLASASMTLVGFIQPYILELFMKKEDEPNLVPGINTLGFTKFAVYAFILTLIYCIVFFTIEAFTTIYWMDWLVSVAGSLVLTMIVILIIDSVRR